MRSTFHGLEVAKRGLFAQQTGINTTAHNIANANTKGYSRQRVNFTTTLPMEMPAMNRSVAPGQLGTGVDFSSIVRLRETFLDNQYRKESTTLGYWTVQKDTLEKIELIFNEPSEDGLRTTIDQFFNAWSDLSREPDNMTARAVVVERAQAMLDAFQHVHTKLKELQEDLRDSFNVKLNQANTLISQIADLNKQIRRIEAMGMHANDLRDQRDLIVDELSRLLPIEVEEMNAEGEKGMYNVYLKYGGTKVQLVNGIEFYPFGGPGIDHDNIINPGNVDPLPVPDNSKDEDWDQYYASIMNELNGGQLHSIWKVQSETVQDYIDDVNALFDAIINWTNVEHTKGYPLNSEQDGVFFFTFIPDKNDGQPIEVGEVEINPAIINDPKLIAAAKNSGGLAGDGENALVLSQLRYKKVIIGDKGFNGTFDEYYRAMLGELGVKTQEAQRQTNNAQLILDSVEFRRQSVSGVSLDEEMANLVQLQHAYNASARMITTVDQALDTIINRMGIVGR